ncbi:MAG: hypothetical protein R6U29_06370 [Desulfosudaceae bacterium]
MTELFSFQRIAEVNGWSMAALGIMIDIMGLAALSLIISRVPYLVGFFEKAGSLFKKSPDSQQLRQESAAPDGLDLSSHDLRHLASTYKACAAKLAEPFQLSEIYRLSEDNGLPHPHLTIKAFREENLMISEGNGLFRWNI